MLANIVHERWVHNSWFDSLQDVQEEKASRYAGVLERANRLHAGFAFLRGRVGPPEHLCITDWSALASFRQRGKGFSNAHPVKRFVVFELHKGVAEAHLINCHTYPRINVLFLSTISEP